MSLAKIRKKKLSVESNFNTINNDSTFPITKKKKKNYIALQINPQFSGDLSYPTFAMTDLQNLISTSFMM